MNSTEQGDRFSRDQRGFQLSRAPAGFVWTAFGCCLFVGGCSAGPDVAATSGDEPPQQAEQASVINVGDQALYILGKCVDVPGAWDYNGNIVQLHDCHGGTNQQWQFWGDGTVRPTFNTNKCLDLWGANTGNHTPIAIHDCNGGANQRWSFSSRGQLVGLGSKCVDVPGASSENHTTLQYYDCHSGSNQMFMRSPPAVGASQFTNLKAQEENDDENEHMCLGIAGGVTGGGTLNFGTGAIVWNCNGAPDQQWTRTFQSDPSGTSGKVDLANKAYINWGGATYPACLGTYWNATPVGGSQASAQFCPQAQAGHTDFIFEYVQHDNYGFPCFTLKDPETELYLGVANAAANPVSNGMNVILWERTASNDQVWCDHSANTGTFTVIPDLMVTNVVYAPPGNASSVKYESTTTVGSTTTTKDSFENSTEVTATGSFEGVRGMGSASVSGSYTFGDSDEHEVDITTTWTNGYTKPGETDGINHDWDEIWFIIRPRLDMKFTPGFGGAPDSTRWQLAEGDGVNTGILYFAYAGELNGNLPMSPQLLDLFNTFGITPDMQAGILKADAFFAGVSPQQGMTTARFAYIGQFAYKPPPGQSPSTQSYSVSQSNTVSDTHEESYSYSVGFETEGSYQFTPLFKGTLKVETDWTWSHSSSQKDSVGNGSEDTLTVGQPGSSYTGPGVLHVYEDRIFKTYAFTLDYAGSVPFTYDGGTGCSAGGVWMHCCPPGQAMVGAHLDHNVFKCAQMQDASGEIIGDFSTHRTVKRPNAEGIDTDFSIRACPFGYVMVGYHRDMDVLACQRIPPYAISNAITGELLDPGTQDGYMHTCEPAPYAYGMSGIDPANNLFLCATSPGLR